MNTRPSRILGKDSKKSAETSFHKPECFLHTITITVKSWRIPEVSILEAKKILLHLEHNFTDNNASSILKQSLRVLEIIVCSKVDIKTQIDVAEKFACSCKTKKARNESSQEAEEEEDFPQINLEDIRIKNEEIEEEKEAPSEMKDESVEEFEKTGNDEEDFLSSPPSVSPLIFASTPKGPWYLKRVLETPDKSNDNDNESESSSLSEDEKEVDIATELSPIKPLADAEKSCCYFKRFSLSPSSNMSVMLPNKIHFVGEDDLDRTILDPENMDVSGFFRVLYEK